MRQPSGHADPRPEEPDNERIAMPHHFDFAPETQAHLHQAVQGIVIAFDVPHYRARAGGQLIQPVLVQWRCRRQTRRPC